MPWELLGTFKEKERKKKKKNPKPSRWVSGSRASSPPVVGSLSPSCSTLFSPSEVRSGPHQRRRTRGICKLQLRSWLWPSNELKPIFLLDLICFIAFLEHYVSSLILNDFLWFWEVMWHFFVRVIIKKSTARHPPHGCNVSWSGLMLEHTDSHSLHAGSLFSAASRFKMSWRSWYKWVLLNPVRSICLHLKEFSGAQRHCKIPRELSILIDSSVLF